MRTSTLRILALAAAATLAFAACSDDDNGGSADGAPTTTAPPTTVAATTTTTVASPGGETVALVENASIGQEILVDSQGRTLYLFTNDTTPGASTCNAACETLWPPLTVDGEPTFGEELDASVFSTFTREDGSTQVQANGHPLYTFTQDLNPGEANGQGTGGVWYVVDAEGNAIQN